MTDTKCPYCNAGVLINHDDGRGYQEDETHQQQCGQCDKYFVFTTTICFYYDAKKADCLNGAEHKWRPVAHSSYFPDWVRCTECGEENRGRYAPKNY